MIAERAVHRAELSLRIVRLNLLNPCAVFNLSPEITCMRLDSVMAIVCLGYHNGQHFSLGTRQRRFAQRRRLIELHGAL